MSISRFFNTITDGAWHSISELSSNLGLQTSKLIQFSKFLSERDLVRFDEQNLKIKVKPIWKLLIPEEEVDDQPKSTVATFVVPPKTTINVQSTCITNMSTVEIEVNLRFTQKIEEVAIKI